MSKYTTILYEVKRDLKLSLVEYIYLDTVYHLQAKTGWAYADNAFYCERLDMTDRNLRRVKNSLIEKDLLESKDRGVRVTAKWMDCYLEGADKMSGVGGQNVRKTGQNVRHSIEKEIEVKENVETKVSTPASSKEKRGKDSDPFTLDEFLTSMRSSPQRHIRLIGEYAEERKPDCSTKGQWRAFVDRNVKVARQISVFSDEQIADAFEKMQNDLRDGKNRKGFITKWTFETVLKYLC